MLSVNFSPFPMLTTERLELRRVTYADAAEIFFMRSDPGMMQYIKRQPCLSIEEARGWVDKVDGIIDNNDGISWGIYLKGDNKLMGTGGTWRFDKDHYRGELGYALIPQYQGQGIMHEALTAIIHYAFHTIGLHSIEANIDPANLASQRVLERLGFAREGYLRESYFYEGVFNDTAVYSLLTSIC